MPTVKDRSPRLLFVDHSGCYWGTEKFIVKDFQKIHPGSIAKASVGFMSPDPKAMENPSYRQVCTGETGHVEVLYVELASEDPEIYEALLKFFFQFHDPTTLNRQVSVGLECYMLSRDRNMLLTKSHFNHHQSTILFIHQFATSVQPIPLRATTKVPNTRLSFSARMQSKRTLPKKSK